MMRTAFAFTLIEILLVIAVIIILMSVLIPVAGMIRKQAASQQTSKLINELSMAFDDYRDSDYRHFYPTPDPAKLDATTGCYYLDRDPSNPASTLMLLENQMNLSTGNGVAAAGYRTPVQSLDQDASSPTHNCLIDPWQRPIYYWLDGPYVTGPTTFDSHLMNGVADRPPGYDAAATAAAAVVDWNPKSVEPFAYFWSPGPPTGGSSDQLPANFRNWICNRTGATR